MAHVPEVLLPNPDERGLATSDPDVLIASVGRAWDLFGDLVDAIDLDAVARGRGLLAREVVIPLGAWPDNRPIDVLLDEARRGVVGDHDQGTLVDEVRERHRDEADDAVRAAVRRQRAELDAFVASPSYADCAALPVASMLGTLPLLTFLHAATYPLATSALDLEQCGAVAPDELLDAGLLGLVDTIGCLAGRQGITASLVARTSTTVVGTGARDGAWRTVVLDPAVADAGPALAGTTRLLLDVTAGRADVPGALARRELTFHDVPGLLALAPIVEQVPGIPGRGALVAAIRAATAIVSLGKLFGRKP
ncbi:MAG TPA: hypothetical protein VFL59_11015 [Candidatus Nanopelagicales bacterium]|nr:hypothetical protein [Candidatus Nanopelagicales bacterium]